MKFLKDFVILVSCIFLSSSVEAGFFDFDKDDPSERLGKAVSVILDVPASEEFASHFEEDRETYTRIESLRNLPHPSPEELQEIQELTKALGRKYENNPSLIMAALKTLTMQYEAAMYYRVVFLMNEIGLLPEDEQDPEKPAFSLIEGALKKDGENYMARGLLFHYFMKAPDRKIRDYAYQQYGKLVAEIALCDQRIFECKSPSMWETRELCPDFQLLQVANKALGVNFEIVSHSAKGLSSPSGSASSSQ